MNSTKILFLKMLKGDIKRHACEKAGIDPNVLNGNLDLLTGQTISRKEIESFSSYKLMNDDERSVVISILNEFKTNVGGERGKGLIKRIDSFKTNSEEVEMMDFKEAA